MRNDSFLIKNTKRIFQYVYLFNILTIIDSKFAKKYNECEQFLNSKDCYYFPCLDAHFPCGPNSHLSRFSYDLCLLSTKKYYEELSVDARLYFNHTNICAMALLHEQLVEEKISARFTCTHLQMMIDDIYLKCFQNNQQENTMIQIIDFCSFICNNLQTMINLFLNLNNDHVNLHRLLIETGKNCGTMINESIDHSIPSLIMSICLDRKNTRLKYDITSIMFNSRFEPNEYDWI